MEGTISVASWSGSLLAWGHELTALKARIGRALPRRELRETGADFLDGLLSGIERKTGWLMAEQSGAERPYRMQSLLGRSHWDADRLRDEVRDYVVEALGDEDGVLIVDETGFVKKGDRSAVVARQYSGTAGRIENSQIGVFLAYASRYGQALVDRRLYLPESWTKDRARCARASIPETVEFATKPKMARAMVEAALDAGVPCAYVLGDAVYGADSSLRRMLEAREQPYVLAVRGAHFMRRGGDRLFEETSPEELASEFEPDDWVCHAAGEGAKGPRLYDWARIGVLGRKKAASSIGFSSAASDRHPEKKPTTWSSPRLVPPWPNWRQWPACAGRSRSALSAPRMISDLIIASSVLARVASPHEPVHGRPGIPLEAIG
ncbi:IS701 family transposase [Mesorhizobium sp. M0199]|uniref:IS701 family transposase n=1 Tax=Mesorhizobium sp. M0199 TaxID=2956911 RepID=UPI00333DCDED